MLLALAAAAIAAMLLGLGEVRRRDRRRAELLAFALRPAVGARAPALALPRRGARPSRRAAPAQILLAIALSGAALVAAGAGASSPGASAGGCGTSRS